MSLLWSVELCYYNETYYRDHPDCHHAYELVQHPEQMMLVYHVLSDHLVMDVVKLIMSMVDQINDKPKCVYRKQYEDN